MKVDKKDIYWVEYAHKNCHPETCCHPANYKLMKNGYAYDYYDDHSQAIADRDLLNARSESAKPASTEWDGEGLPPVGCECEMKLPNSDWLRGTVKYVNKCGVVFKPWGTAIESFISTATTSMEFRPLRTKEQREREETVDAALKVCGYDPSEFKGDDIPKRDIHDAWDAINDLYDAGMLKKEKQDD